MATGKPFRQERLAFEFAWSEGKYFLFRRNGEKLFRKQKKQPARELLFFSLSAFLIIQQQMVGFDVFHQRLVFFLAAGEHPHQLDKIQIRLDAAAVALFTQPAVELQATRDIAG